MSTSVLVTMALVIYAKEIPNAPPALLLAQVNQESRWNPRARSPVGAIGLTQFMPATWRWLGGAYGLGVGDPTSPADSLKWQSIYMRHLSVRVSPATTMCDRWMFALSDYNGGAGWRMKRQKRSATPGDYFPTSLINPGITPANQHENETYSRKIYASQGRYPTQPALTCDKEK